MRILDGCLIPKRFRRFFGILVLRMLKRIESDFLVSEVTYPCNHHEEPCEHTIRCKGHLVVHICFCGWILFLVTFNLSTYCKFCDTEQSKENFFRYVDFLLAVSMARQTLPGRTTLSSFLVKNI